MKMRQSTRSCWGGRTRRTGSPSLQIMARLVELASPIRRGRPEPIGRGEPGSLWARNPIDARLRRKRPRHRRLPECRKSVTSAQGLGHRRYARFLKSVTRAREHVRGRHAEAGYIDADVMRVARILAARSGRRDSEVVENALREYAGLAVVERVRSRNRNRPFRRGSARARQPGAARAAARARRAGTLRVGARRRTRPRHARLGTARSRRATGPGPRPLAARRARARRLRRPPREARGRPPVAAVREPRRRPADGYLFALARAAQADLIVSGDAHLTGLAQATSPGLTPRGVRGHARLTR